MIVLWLLGGFLAVGFSYDELEYGDTYRIRLPRKTQSIEFTSMNRGDVTTLWNRDEPLNSDRYEVVGSYFSIEKVNRRDSGTYRMKDKDQNELSTKTLDVNERRAYNTKTVGRYFVFTYDLEPASCNIYFIPDNGYETEIVRKGELLEDFDHQNCDGLEYLYPCGISKRYIEPPCSGSFEIRDEHGDVALVETVEVEPKEQPAEFDTSYIGIGVGVFFGVVSFCCCIRRCCCKKSSSKKDMSQSPDEAPTAHYHQYNSEPVGPRTDQLSRPSETLYPTVPSYNPSVPLIHNPPSVSVPPAYSEGSAPAEQAGAPTFPVPSEDPEPRFELSIPSALPLSSNSTFSDVYTSDKLNFC